MKIELVGIVPSHLKNKKFEASFWLWENGLKRKKTVQFGAKGYEDYTTHHDEERKRRYQIRHRNDNLTDPTSPGALSWYILWNKKSLKDSIKDYRNKFNV